MRGIHACVSFSMHASPGALGATSPPMSFPQLGERGWNRLPDGALLDAMAGEIDVLITVDRGLPFQQRLSDRPFAVIVLRAKSNRLDALQPLVPALLKALGKLKPGEVREIAG